MKSSENKRMTVGFQPGAVLYHCMLSSFRYRRFPAKARRVRYEQPYKKELHIHDFPQVWYCVSGEYIHTVDGSVYICRPGSLLTVPPGKAHSYITGNDPVELICLEATFYFLRKLSSDAYINAITHMFCHAFSEMLRFSPEIYRELQRDDREQAEGLLSDLCSLNFKDIQNKDIVRRKIGEFYLLPVFCLSKKERSAAERVIADKIEPIYDAVLYCNRNHFDVIEVCELVSIAKMSRTVFFESFKMLIGTTSVNYITALRISRALILIEYSSFSLQEIADMLSFSSDRYMSVVFKQYYGKTIGEFKKDCTAREGQDEMRLASLDDAFFKRVTIE